MKDWRISTANGVLLASYFIPAWTIVAFKIMVSPVHGLYDRPNVAVALFVSDHLNIAAASSVRVAWLLALGKLTTVAFFAIFLVFVTRRSLRKRGDCDEALWFALAIGGAISFASLIMASKVGEFSALRLHVSELLVMLGAVILLAMEPPLEAEEPTRHSARNLSDQALSSPSS